MFCHVFAREIHGRLLPVNRLTITAGSEKLVGGEWWLVDDVHLLLKVSCHSRTKPFLLLFFNISCVLYTETLFLFHLLIVF